jgi:putative ABC transport system permease protein
MIKHLFTLIWNKKKQNGLLISEIFLSFLVMFGIFTALAWCYRNYNKPMGMNFQNVWIVDYNNTYETNNSDSLYQYYELLRTTLKSLPMVEEVSYSSNNIPFSNNVSQSGMTYNKKHYDHINWYVVGDTYPAVLGMQLLEGRWYHKEDAASNKSPIVINRTFKEELFGQQSAIGKFIGNDDDKEKREIIGVVEDVKVKGDYMPSGRSMYNRLDTGSIRSMGRMLVKVRPGANAAFEGRLYKTLAGYMKTANIEIEHMADNRKTINYWAVVPMIVGLIVATFLIINVALGLFGVLWYNINRRKGEIGLRRAVGATGKSVSAQLVGESMIIATLSMIVGIFFAVQFPLLNVFDLPAGVYIAGIILSVLFIYTLVLICSFYPGKQAAAIYPAVALHEE